MSTTAAKPRRLDAYIRVSKVAGREGDSFISPKVQEERIRAWAAFHGHEIIAVHHELDVSGGTMDRPKLNEVMRRIDAEETDGIVVWRIDRFGRTLAGGAPLIDHIRQKGALFASVEDNFDVTKETGRLLLRILLSFAEYERERIQASWRTARNEAVGRGIHVASVTPYGYVRGQGPTNPKTGKPAPAPLEIDHDHAEVVRGILARRAAGESWATIRDWLSDAGVPSPAGGGWRTASLAQIVRNPVYLGTARGGYDGAREDAHPALVDETTWHAAQSRRSIRRDQADSPTLLRGLVRCAGCRYVMSTLRVARDGDSSRSRLIYRCSRQSQVGDCPDPTGDIVGVGVNGAPGVDDVVIALMWDKLDPLRFEAIDDAGDPSELEAELRALERRREEDANDPDFERAMGRVARNKHLAGLTDQVEALQAEIDERLARAGRPAYDAELRQKWESGEMSVAEMRDHLARAIRAVFVRPDRDGQRRMPRRPQLRRDYIARRLDIVWVTDGGELDIPRQGRRVFDPVKAPGGYRMRPWSDAHPNHSGVMAP